ncbi:hypothetical protein [Halobaculum magnesiiphilum]|uniref:Uncharacterized protein n=1 Tax=Halobaculum magnesiiphilum TaxID=1017351 RepID=A0A8T8WGR6_9EURY|nr:hypothetical protein [Halobaculum magnesiiphilum]QZP39049.1 hypothetical protein K6T50_06900 [Halobaculum magnesiiphilum]
MRERAGTNRLKLWLLVDADRWLVAAGFLAAVFVLLFATGVLVPGAATLLADGDPIETTFQPLIGGTITVVTLVLTLNQLVLSQELGAVGDQRERMEGATEFRRDVADTLGRDVMPPEPAAFLRELVIAAGQRADDVDEALADDEELADDAARLVDSVRGNAETVGDNLDDAQFGTFAVVSAALNFNYSWKLYESRRLRASHDLTDEQDEALSALGDVLELFGPAREHFKTLYFQWELVDLSRSVLWAAVPSLVIAFGSVLYLSALVPGAPATGVYLAGPLVVSLVAAVGLLPFAILLSYVLRIATVTKRTLSIGPFTLRETTPNDD